MCACVLGLGFVVVCVVGFGCSVDWMVFVGWVLGFGVGLVFWMLGLVFGGFGVGVLGWCLGCFGRDGLGCWVCVLYVLSQGCGWLWLGFWDRVLGLCVCYVGLACWLCSDGPVVWLCVAVFALMGWVAGLCFSGLGCAWLGWVGLRHAVLGLVVLGFARLGCAGHCWAAYLPTYLPAHPPTPNNGSGRGPPSTFPTIPFM